MAWNMLMNCVFAAAKDKVEAQEKSEREAAEKLQKQQVKTSHCRDSPTISKRA